MSMCVRIFLCIYTLAMWTDWLTNAYIHGYLYTAFLCLHGIKSNLHGQANVNHHFSMEFLQYVLWKDSQDPQTPDVAFMVRLSFLAVCHPASASNRKSSLVLKVVFCQSTYTHSPVLSHWWIINGSIEEQWLWSSIIVTAACHNLAFHSEIRPWIFQLKQRH